MTPTTLYNSLHLRNCHVPTSLEVRRVTDAVLILWRCQKVGNTSATTGTSGSHTMKANRLRSAECAEWSARLTTARLTSAMYSLTKTCAAVDVLEHIHGLELHLVSGECSQLRHVPAPGGSLECFRVDCLPASESVTPARAVTDEQPEHRPWLQDPHQPHPHCCLQPQWHGPWWNWRMSILTSWRNMPKFWGTAPSTASLVGYCSLLMPLTCPARTSWSDMTCSSWDASNLAKQSNCAGMRATLFLKVQRAPSHVLRPSFYDGGKSSVPTHFFVRLRPCLCITSNIRAMSATVTGPAVVDVDCLVVPHPKSLTATGMLSCHVGERSMRTVVMLETSTLLLLLADNKLEALCFGACCCFHHRSAWTGGWAYNGVRGTLVDWGGVGSGRGPDIDLSFFFAKKCPKTAETGMRSPPGLPRFEHSSYKMGTHKGKLLHFIFTLKWNPKTCQTQPRDQFLSPQNFLHQGFESSILRTAPCGQRLG